MATPAENVSTAFKAIRRIQQYLEIWEAGEYTIPGTSIVETLDAGAQAELLSSFQADRTACINALNDIGTS